VPSFPFWELSIIVVPDVSDMSHTATSALDAEAGAVPRFTASMAAATAPIATRHHPDSPIIPDRSLERSRYPALLFTASGK
jgi:hypothetical protein